MQAMIGAPYPAHFNADPKTPAEWKELINRRAKLAIAGLPAMNVSLVLLFERQAHIHDVWGGWMAGQVSMLGLPGGSGTRCAGASGITTADSTVRSGRTPPVASAFSSRIVSGSTP